MLFVMCFVIVLGEMIGGCVGNGVLIICYIGYVLFCCYNLVFEICFRLVDLVVNVVV